MGAAVSCVDARPTLRFQGPGSGSGAGCGARAHLRGRAAQGAVKLGVDAPHPTARVVHVARHADGARLVGCARDHNGHMVSHG
eukprot:3237774-Prymnesium_polylepis.1